MLINIPFAGFYESLYSSAIDNEEESYIEWKFEEGDITQEQRAELANLLWRHTDYRVAYETVARDYVDAFAKKFEEWSEVPFKLKYDGMDSPREYNFTTDRLFADVDEEAIVALRAKVDENALREMVRRRFTSYDGFISFYANNLDDWPEDVTAWDCNQLCTLIMCFMPDDWGWEMYDATFTDCEAYQAWESAVDWPKIDEFLEKCKETAVE